MKLDSREIGAVIIEVDDRVLIEYVNLNYSPEDIFSEDELGRWAKRNGYEESGDE